jgi:SHS2 domain-containing protein
MFETFDHTADLGLRVRAADLPTLLTEAARALFSAIVPDLASVRPAQRIELRVVGQEPDLLLFDWLSELLYRFETERMLLAEFDVRLTDEGIEAQARGEPIDPARHVLEHEVKAITYHGLRVEQSADGWLAEVIVDI